MEFSPGDILQSKRSGRHWVVADTKMTPPEILNSCVPLRKHDWPAETFCWQNPKNFTLIQPSLFTGES